MVQDKLGVKALVLSMSRQLLSFYPVRDGEVKMRASGKQYDVQAVGFLLVMCFHQYDECCIVAIAGKLGYTIVSEQAGSSAGVSRTNLTDTVFVRVRVCSAPDVIAIGKQCGENLGFLVQGAIDGGCDENLWHFLLIKDGRELIFEEFWGYIKIGGSSGRDGVCRARGAFRWL